MPCAPSGTKPDSCGLKAQGKSVFSGGCLTRNTGGYNEASRKEAATARGGLKAANHDVD
jgi:hypothetical protein